MNKLFLSQMTMEHRRMQALLERILQHDQSVQSRQEMTATLQLFVRQHLKLETHFYEEHDGEYLERLSTDARTLTRFFDYLGSTDPAHPAWTDAAADLNDFLRHHVRVEEMIIRDVLELKD